MKLDILMSCMHQKDFSLVEKSKIYGNAVIINQCDTTDYSEYQTQNGIAKMYSVCDRGLTKSRNMAIGKSNADVCLLCDDDEVFVTDYEDKIISAYKSLPQADVIIFKMQNRASSFSDKVQPIKFPKTMKVSSWQISFRRESLINNSVLFDELLGAGTDNGAEEELKFLQDCIKAKLKIFYVPTEIASVAQQSSTWFKGYDEEFFEKRGGTTRYILGVFTASLYALYYVIRKRKQYNKDISFWKALKAIFRGIRKNSITKQAKVKRKGM